MQCTSTWMTIKKNGEPVKVACGDCLACRINKKTFWQNRIAYDVMAAARKGFGSSFVCLSYDDENNPLNVQKDEAVRFVKRIRKNLGHDLKISHFTIGEYGDQGQRPHYHSIMIGLDSDVARHYVRKSWKKGFVTAEPVTSGRIRYVVDYLDCTSWYAKEEFKKLCLEPPFNVHSNGIGHALFNAQRDMIMETAHYISRGRAFPLTDYWLNKLGVSIRAREDFLWMENKRRFEEYLSSRSPLSFSAYAADIAHQRELIAYTRMINRLQPRYGKPVAEYNRFMPEKVLSRLKYESIIKECVV